MSIDDLQDEEENGIYNLVEAYYKDWHKPKWSKFTPGITPIPVSGKVYNQAEMIYLAKAMLDFHLTDGEMCEEFARDLKRVCDRRYAVLCNSGSSANLLMISALAKPKGYCVTPAVGFPTTLTPIIQSGMVPVFIDVDPATMVPTKGKVLNAIYSQRTELVVLPHTLGNVAPIVDLVPNVITFVYDCCDALGSNYDGVPVTSYGNAATLSFYPAHHITTGEGGAILTSDSLLKRKLESLRDWGRDCWCNTGCDDTCNKRFEQQFGDLPYGYDHKYVYTEMGYNLKMTDLQASIGIPQLDKLPAFIQSRKDNFQYYLARMKRYEEHFILPEASSPKADPAWFGFWLTIRPESPIKRLDLIKYLEEHKIATRLVFGGNLIKQPAFKNTQYRIVGNLTNADLITTNSFWIGVYPGITPAMREYVMDCFDDFMKKV